MGEANNFAKNAYGFERSEIYGSGKGFVLEGKIKNKSRLCEMSHTLLNSSEHKAFFFADSRGYRLSRPI